MFAPLLSRAEDDDRANEKNRDARPLSVHVTPKVTVEGGVVRARIRATRDAMNRVLRVVVDAPSYYARSDIDLEGARGAVAHDFVFDSLPDGAYVVAATLLRADGAERSAENCFVVLGRREENEAFTAAPRGAAASFRSASGSPTLPACH